MTADRQPSALSRYVRILTHSNVLSSKPSASATTLVLVSGACHSSLTRGQRGRCIGKSSGRVSSQLLQSPCLTSPYAVAACRTVSGGPYRSSQRSPIASCLRSFRAWPTGSFRARRSASVACFLSGEGATAWVCRLTWRLPISRLFTAAAASSCLILSRRPRPSGNFAAVA